MGVAINTFYNIYLMQKPETNRRSKRKGKSSNGKNVFQLDFPFQTHLLLPKKRLMRDAVVVSFLEIDIF